jgi:hypothetical protein
MVAKTWNPGPRKPAIFLHLAGDSTITSDLDNILFYNYVKGEIGNQFFIRKMLNIKNKQIK